VKVKAAKSDIEELAKSLQELKQKIQTKAITNSNAIESYNNLADKFSKLRSELSTREP